MSSTTLSRRMTLALVSGLLLASVAGSPAGAQSPNPDASVSAPAVVPTSDPADGAIPAVPNPTIISPIATPWQSIEVAPDGRTLTVYFWNGSDGCNGLKDVEVTVVGGVTTVTVYTGILPDAMSRSCVAALFLYKTNVVLEAPILGGGAV